MADRGETLRRAHAAGFEGLATHVLADEGWDACYGALAAALAVTPAGTLPPWFTDGMAREVALRRRAEGCSGYVFSVLRPRTS